MWTPTVYFVNQKDSKIIDVSSINVFVSICPNGNVYYSFRVQTTLFCGMNLRKFPFDNQTCSVQVESWLHSSDDMIMTWENDAPVSTNVITLAEYQLTGLTEYNSTFSFPEAGPVGKASWRVHKHTLNYSRLVLDFHMLREPGYYLLDYYIPSGFLVIVSWVSFWLSPDAAPARVTLGTSTMLTFITLSNIIKDSLPKVSYTKRVDIWLFVCTTFIFLSLVEFAFVNTIHRRKKNVELKKVTAKHVLKSTIKPSASQVQLGRAGLSSSCSKLDKLGSNHSQIGYGDLLVPCSPKSPERPNVFFIGAQTDDIITSVKELNAKSRTMASKDQFKISSSMDLGLNSSGSTATSVLASNLALEVQAIVCDGAVESPRRVSVFQRPFVEMTPPQIAKWIDTRSRWLFPICFLATNIVYWISITI